MERRLKYILAGRALARHFIESADDIDRSFFGKNGELLIGYDEGVQFIAGYIAERFRNGHREAANRYYDMFFRDVGGWDIYVPSPVVREIREARNSDERVLKEYTPIGLDLYGKFLKRLEIPKEFAENLLGNLKPKNRA